MTISEPTSRTPSSFPRYAKSPFCSPIKLAPLALALVPPPPQPPAAHDPDKWKIFDAIRTAHSQLGISERSLNVLHALLSFWQPGTLPSSGPIIVFPSNRSLSVRAHGMAESTLRRHLGHLVAAGIIIRRDSPNGKRYPCRGRSAAIESAFGFDLSPLVSRAVEYEALAAEQIECERQQRIIRAEITLLRRDAEQMIAVGRYDRVPGDWDLLEAGRQALSRPLPRRASALDMMPVRDQLVALVAEVEKALADHIKNEKMNGTARQNERHLQPSNIPPICEVEPSLREGRGETAAATSTEQPVPRPKTRHYPLPMVLQACPDVLDYAEAGSIRSWAEFVAVSEKIRPYMGISASAWSDACAIFGREDAAVVAAAILQRMDSIRSPGGYIRALTARAREGSFSLGPMLMALLRSSVRSG